MANITRISAGKGEKKPEKPAEPVKKTKKAPKTEKVEKTEKPLKQTFILFRPFVALGRYIKNSWQEMRQVRWPNRKYTWKMTIAMLVYCAIFLVFIVLLDLLFTLLFNNLLG